MIFIVLQQCLDICAYELSSLGCIRNMAEICNTEKSLYLKTPLIIFAFKQCNIPTVTVLIKFWKYIANKMVNIFWKEVGLSQQFILCNERWHGIIMYDYYNIGGVMCARVIVQDKKYCGWKCRISKLVRYCPQMIKSK